ncbi:HAD-like domain-containing protein [Lactarius akahatsu]|uniref:HAD-like domain-containing protein n=1 Tax=Lactarius akahatsu TaxID=416441 RepID=A0AAD4LBY0_9AGAM|nr:HAD-like domain-containing protein [Lactarius akahatsu]
MTDFLGYGKEKRREGNLEILAGRVTFRDAFREMLESVSKNGHSFEECKQVLKDSAFFQYCKSQDIPVIIVSSGMEPLIRAILSNLLKFTRTARWNIKYRHPSSGYGHDKSQAILPYRNLTNRPLLFFFGDGVSDLSAAKHADVLFVKEKLDGENDLATYCTRENIPHVLFPDFSRALLVVRSIVEGTKTPEEWFGIGRA